MQYNYSKSRDFCRQLGLVFDERWVPQLNATFSAAGLEQWQIEEIMREHIWHVKMLFTPNQYTFGSRVLLATHFLFGPLVARVKLAWSRLRSWRA